MRAINSVTLPGFLRASTEEKGSAEFKKAFHYTFKFYESLAKTICAFSNSSGGQIIFGVDEGSNIIGIEDRIKAEDKIMDVIRDYIYPKLIPSITTTFYKTEEDSYVGVLCISIYPNSPLRPYYVRSKNKKLKDVAYIRKDNKNLIARAQDIEVLKTICKGKRYLSGIVKEFSGLDKQDKLIVKILKKQFENKGKGLSTQEITNKLNLSKRTIRNRLSCLVDMGIVGEICKSSTDPTKRYFLKKIIF